MGFFDNLSKKANDAYQTTKEKTAQVTGEIKLKSQINDFNDQIQVLYKELGSMVFEAFKSNTDVSKDDITPKCEEIKSLLEKIDKIKIEILSLKNKKKCVACQTEMDENAKFCPKCGKEQPTVTETEAEVSEAPEDVEEVEAKVEESEVKEKEDKKDNE